MGDLLQGLVSGFGGLAWTLIFFVVALSVIVAIHELGHYLVARWCGIGADVFSVGMGPVLFARTDKRGTQWQVAALPFGGYVKFVGDSNAASVGADADAPVSKASGMSIHVAPLWARAATVAAGPAFNFILAFFLFAGLALSSGRPVEPLTVGSIAPVQAEGAVLEAGDVVVGIGGRAATTGQDLRDAAADLPVAATYDWQVERDGRVRDVTGPHPFPAIVSSVQPLSAASEAGLLEGDIVLEANGVVMPTFEALRDTVVNGDGSPVILRVQRGDEIIELTVEPRRVDIPRPEGGFETRWLLGLVGGLAFEPATTSTPLPEAVTGAFSQIGFLITSSLEGLWSMVTGVISTCNLSGPIGIAEASGAMASEGTMDFIFFIGVLSVAVGLINLFPVPILDGGHLVFHAWEAVTGRPPSDRVLRVLMAGGLTAILMLMGFAILTDLTCP